MPHGSNPALGSVLIVTGPPGAGKSTVAPLVAARLGPMAACIEADWFWTTIVAGFIPPWEQAADHQNRAVLRAVMATAAELATGGNQVVVDGVVGPWHLDVVSDVVGPRGIRVYYTVLRPDLDTCLVRARGRATEPARVPGHPPLTDTGPIRHLWQQFSDLGRYEFHAINTERLDPVATADAIVGQLQSGELTLLATG